MLGVDMEPSAPPQSQLGPGRNHKRIAKHVLLLSSICGLLVAGRYIRPSSLRDDVRLGPRLAGAPRADDADPHAVSTPRGDDARPGIPAASQKRDEPPRPESYDLKRFVAAQARVPDAGVLAHLFLGHGHPVGHWIPVVFPHLRGPGADQYTIRSLGEARAYLQHPVLGARLRQWTRFVVMQDASALELFGRPYDMAFQASMTLFAEADLDPLGLFSVALRKFFGGAGDAATLELLRAHYVAKL